MSRQPPSLNTTPVLSSDISDITEDVTTEGPICQAMIFGMFQCERAPQHPGDHAAFLSAAHLALLGKPAEYQPIRWGDGTRCVLHFGDTREGGES